MWWIFLLIPGLLIIFLAIIIMRTITFKPIHVEKTPAAQIPVNAGETAQRLARMLQCKTISYRDESQIDKEEMDKFCKLLTELYPNVNKQCKVEYIDPRGVLYTWQGKEDKSPVVLMSHFDVVPADESKWDKPAFEGIIENNELWGRGALDTKGTLCAIMEAAERLIDEGFVPNNTIYIAFSGDEEVAGPSAPNMVELLQSRGISPALVLDEGGFVVDDIFPGVKHPCALIGTAEKGMMDLEFTVESKGGHASYPPPHTSVGILAQAVAKIEKNPFEARITPPVAAMFNNVGRHSSFAFKLIFANLWCFKPVLSAICKKRGGELNAMMRTTCAFTKMEGSNAFNVLPPVAKVGANLRILDGETTDNVIARLKTLIEGYNIEVNKVYGMNPSPNSPDTGEGWKALTSAISQTWPESVITPYLMFATTDSRHYCKISGNVYRFSAMALSRQEIAMVHAHNERIPLDTLVKIVQFYNRLILQC